MVRALSVPASVAQEQPDLSGNLFIHDPTIIAGEEHFASFATGVERHADGGMPRTKSSKDGVRWEETGALPGGMPQWIVDELGFTPLNIWAPDISEYQGTHYLYYSASTFGKNTSLIGLMTNDGFNAEDPAAGWVDRGLVIRSRSSDSFNAIDPHRFDDADGRAFLLFGSFWDGIRMVQIDPATGKRLAGAASTRMASRSGGPIEAPAMLFNDGYYYLLVAFDFCCRGPGSTYRIMVGRASSVEGPFRDRDGTALVLGGGTELLSGTNARRGPGGQDVFTGPDGPMLAYHYYDQSAGWAPKLQITPIHFDANGWPYVDPMPED